MSFKLKNILIGTLGFLAGSILLGIVFYFVSGQTPMSGIFWLLFTMILTPLGLISGIILPLIFNESQQSKINLVYLGIFVFGILAILFFLMVRF